MNKEKGRREGGKYVGKKCKREEKKEANKEGKRGLGSVEFSIVKKKLIH